MESTNDETIDANFEHVLAALYAQRRMLLMLFVSDPDAARMLLAQDPEMVENTLMPRSISDHFINRVKSELRTMQELVSKALDR